MMQCSGATGMALAVVLAAACSASVQNDGAAGDSAAGRPAEPREPAQLTSRNTAAGHADSSARTGEQHGPTISTVVLRNERLVIRAGAVGPRFTVVTNEGAIVSEDLDEATLAARHDDLFEVYSSAYARGGPYLDARLDVPAGGKDPVPPGFVHQLGRIGSLRSTQDDRVPGP